MTREPPVRDDASPPPGSRRRRRRWPFVLLACVAAGLVAWFVGVPYGARVFLARQLRSAGFEVVEIGAVVVRPSRLEVHNVRLAEADAETGELTIANVVAGFALADLREGRIDTLVADGVVWTRSAAPDRAASPFDLAAVRSAAPAHDRRLLALPLRRGVLRNVVVATRGAPPEERLRFEVSFEGAGAALQVEAQIEHGEHLATLRTNVAEDDGAIGGDVALRVTGGAEVVLDGRVRVAPADQRVEFRFDDASLAANGVQANGLAAELTIDGFTAPTTASPQMLRWRELRAGAITAGSGEATFDLAAGPELRAQVIQRTTDGAGSITVRELRWTPATERFPMAIDVAAVPLREWIELASNGRVTGDGRLDGELAVVVGVAPQLAIDLLSGRLVAAPGGLVRFLDHPDTDVLIRQHVQQIAASTGHDTLVQDRLVAALKEFRYTALEFVFDRDTAHDDTTLRVHLAGAGANVPQQLDMDLNLHGFDTALDTALAIKLGLDRARERLDRKVEAPANGPPQEK